MNRPFFLIFSKTRGFVERELVRTGIEKKFFELVSDLVQKEGLELYAMDYLGGQQVLRIFIQNPETKTATLDHCAQVDRAMTPFVEELDWMPEELTLEVSSPGVYRDIKEGKQFTEAVGERVSLSLYRKVSSEDFLPGQAVDNKVTKDKKIFAFLVEAKEEEIYFSSEKGAEAQFKVKLEDIKKANVEPLWEDLKDH